MSIFKAITEAVVEKAKEVVGGEKGIAEIKGVISSVSDEIVNKAKSAANDGTAIVQAIVSDVVETAGAKVEEVSAQAKGVVSKVFGEKAAEAPAAPEAPATTGPVAEVVKTNTEKLKATPAKAMKKAVEKKPAKKAAAPKMKAAKKPAKKAAAPKKQK